MGAFLRLDQAIELGVELGEAVIVAIKDSHIRAHADGNFGGIRTRDTATNNDDLRRLGARNTAEREAAAALRPHQGPGRNLHRHAPNICIEVGRQNTPGPYRPSFSDLEDALKAVKSAA